MSGRLGQCYLGSGAVVGVELNIHISSTTSYENFFIKYQMNVYIHEYCV